MSGIGAEAIANMLGGWNAVEWRKFREWLLYGGRIVRSYQVSTNTLNVL